MGITREREFSTGRFCSSSHHLTDHRDEHGHYIIGSLDVCERKGQSVVRRTNILSNVNSRVSSKTQLSFFHLEYFIFPLLVAQ